MNFEKKFVSFNESWGIIHGGDVFSIGAKAGANYNIPNTNVDVGVDLKFRWIVPFATEFDVCFGGKYRFAK